jgi:hypothetical protein
MTHPGHKFRKIEAGGTDTEREPQRMEGAEAKIEGSDPDELRRQSSAD